MRGAVVRRTLPSLSFHSLFRYLSARLLSLKSSRPLGQLAAIVTGRDPGSGFVIDPVSSVGGESSGQNGGSVFQCDGEDPRLALRGQLHLVAQSVGEKISRRGSRRIAAEPDQLSAIVLHGSDGLFLLRIPPLVGDNAVPARVRSGEQGRMAGGGAGVRVVVVAVGEVRAVVEQQAEAALAELVAVALEIISAKLIDHDDDYQFGMTVISGSECGTGQTGAKQHREQGCTPGESHRDRSVQPARYQAKPSRHRGRLFAECCFGFKLERLQSLHFAWGVA